MRRAAKRDGNAEQVFDLHCRAMGLPAATKEHRFHPTRKWRFDRAWLDKKVAVEIEGGIWTRGRHVRPQGFLDDCEKYNAATLLGWQVFRFPTDMVTSGVAASITYEALSVVENES